MAKPGWGAVVEGNTVDLKSWVDNLRSDFDGPWVETHGSQTVLRSAPLDELTDPNDVRDRAASLIARLNGAFAIAQEARPIRLGEVVEIDANGALRIRISLEGGTFLISGNATNFVWSGADGKPRQSEVQHWSTVADKYERLHDALVYFGRATDWFDVYKALECLQDEFGGEKKFLALNWVPVQIKDLKHTANWAARHRAGKFDRPSNPMSLDAARALLGQVIRQALTEIKNGQ